MELINKLDQEFIRGKIIDSIENESVNYFIINFTDGSYIEFETTYVSSSPGIYGIEQKYHEREDID